MYQTMKYFFYNLKQLQNILKIKTIKANFFFKVTYNKNGLSVQMQGLALGSQISLAILLKYSLMKQKIKKTA